MVSKHKLSSENIFYITLLEVSKKLFSGFLQQSLNLLTTCLYTPINSKRPAKLLSKLRREGEVQSNNVAATLSKPFLVLGTKMLQKTLQQKVNMNYYRAMHCGFFLQLDTSAPNQSLINH